jgi:antitoxin HicB
MRTVEEYLELPYRISLLHDEDEDGNAGWVAEVDELPGCLSQGETPDEAVANVRDAMEGWISVALEDGQRIPEPRAPNSYSGRLVVRMARSLHAELAREAELEGVSLNALITTALARSMGEHEAREARADVLPSGRGNGLEERRTGVVPHEVAD